MLHGTVKNAVNVPAISAELMTILRPYVILLERMGSLQAQLSDSALTGVEVLYAGAITSYDVAPLTTAVLKGLLTPILKHDVNFVNAPHIAAERGIEVVESKRASSEDFTSLVKLTVKSLEGENIVSGTIFGKNLPRILRINDFYLEAIPQGHILLIRNRNTPGVIGRVTSALAGHSINIARMHVGEEAEKKQNVILITTGSIVSDHILGEIRSLEDVFSARRIEL